MKLYSCKVRLGGSLYNEVRKHDVTAPEILVLRQIHGLVSPDSDTVDASAVVEIKPAGDVARTDGEERARLSNLYNPALRKQKKSITLMFGVGIALPQHVEGVDAPAGRVVDFEPSKPEAETTPKRRGRPPKAAPIVPEDDLAELAG